MKRIKKYIVRFKRLDIPTKLSVIAIAYIILGCIYINILTIMMWFTW